MHNIEYFGTKDFMRLLGCGKTYANELMHKFEHRGQAYRLGKNKYRVKRKTFEDYMENECRIEGVNERARRMAK